MNEIEPTETLPPTPTEKPAKRGVSSLVWGVLGLGVGIASTAVVLSHRPTGTTVAMRPTPSPAATSPASVPPAKNTTPIKPVLDATPDDKEGKKTPLEGSLLQAKGQPLPMNPFGDSALVLPKLPLPDGRAPLTGIIAPGEFPTAPNPTPLAPTKNPGTPATAPAAKPSAGTPDGPGSKYLNELLAKGLPEPPPALTIPTTTPATTPTKPAVAEGQVRLVSVSRIAPDRAGAADNLTEVVKGFGGKVQVLTEQGSDRKPQVKGLLAFVPEKSAPDLLKELSSDGNYVEQFSWTGTPSARRARLVEDANARIASLKKLRTVLLVTYLEDAEPVKDVDEEIAKANKSIGELSTDEATDNMTIVRVTFVGK